MSTPSARPAAPPALSELIRREMMADFSDKLSMEEISTCAYRIVENYLSTPLPPPQARTPHTTDDLAKEYEGVSPKGISYLEWLELEVLKARRSASAPQEAGTLWKLLDRAKVRYSRNHGMPNPSEPFPVEVVIDLDTWRQIREIQDNAERGVPLEETEK